MVLNSNCFAQSFDQKGLKAQYYNKADFTDSAFTRRDANINLTRKAQLSHTTISGNEFFVRWSGYIVPEYSEKYTFSVTASGAVKLWVNDSLIFKSNQPGSSTSGSIHLTKGVQYSFRSQFSNSAATMYCKLYWQSKSRQRSIIPESHLIPEGAELPPIRVITNVVGRDPFVTLGPDGLYYMIHTSCYLNGNLAHKNCWDNNDGLHLWKSHDLKNWTDTGLIWSIEKNGTWQKEYDSLGRRPLWAPEIHYIKSKKNWYIVYSMGTFAPLGIRTGLFKSTSGKPEGPYVDVVDGPIVQGIDGSLFEDDDNKVYFLHDNCMIAQMNEEMNGFVEPFRQLQTPSGKPVGFEGSGIIKIAQKYYLFAAEGNEDMGTNSYDLTISSANNIYGPYSEHWMALRHGGHGTLFYDKEHNLWTTMFGTDDLTQVYITPSLIKMTVETNGKILPIRGNARARVILPMAEIKATKWKYTNADPSPGWNQISFNDSSWLQGLAGFGKEANTSWVSGDIWMRKIFNPGSLSAKELENLIIDISYNDGVEVYINGIEACRMEGFNKYSLKKISTAAKFSIKPNKENLIAIHCHKKSDDQFIDAGLITWTDDNLTN